MRTKEQPSTKEAMKWAEEAQRREKGPDISGSSDQPHSCRRKLIYL